MEGWENHDHNDQGWQENNPDNHDEHANDTPEVAADNEQQNTEEPAVENIDDDTDIDDPGEAETRFSSDGDLSWEQAERIANFSIAFMRSPTRLRWRRPSILAVDSSSP